MAYKKFIFISSTFFVGFILENILENQKKDFLGINWSRKKRDMFIFIMSLLLIYLEDKSERVMMIVFFAIS